MNKQFPFSNSIKELCAIQNLHLESETSTLIDENKWLNDLLWMSKFAFDHEWNAYRTTHSIQQGAYPIGKKILNDFLVDFKAEKILKTYPHLVELISKNLRFKNYHLKEVINFFEEDKDDLIAFFNFEKNVSIKKISPGEGDTHLSGKSTSIVHLTNGKQLVYKPRSGELDQMFNTLLEEINSANIGVDFQRINLLNKTTHSWVEFINQLPVDEENQIENYFKRCGALIGLSYLVMGFDLHFENIIAHGEYPILIDLECMFKSDDTQFDVLSIGLVPQLFAVQDTFFDCSGLGADGKGETTPFWQWVNLNTDQLDLIKESTHFSNGKNQLFFDGKLVSPKNFLNQIIEGYQIISDWFLHKKETNEINNLFSVFKDKTIRVLPRSTQTYSNILENSYLLNALKSSDERSEIIAKSLDDFTFLPTVADEHKERIREHEKEALLRMDIPYFTANTSRTYLEQSGQKVIENFFREPPYNFILNRIKTLDRKDIQEQINLIKDAFAARYHLKDDKHESSKSVMNTPFSIDHELALIIDKIVNIAQEEDEKYIWKSYQASGSGKIFLGGLNDSLYSGRLGIAIFLAAYLKKKKNHEIQQIVDSIIHDVILNLSAFLTGIDQSSFLSFSKGITGIIYTLLKIDPIKYKETALHLTSFFTDELIAKTTENDLLEGCSGALISLIELYKIEPVRKLKDKIQFIGEKLLRERSIDKKTGLHIWKSSFNNNPLTGLAHGASGIAYAILKLYELTSESKYLEAFYEAVNFEDFYFSDKENNWCDLRNRNAAFHNTWCYGATGIGMVRLYAYQALNDPRFLKDVKNVIALIRSESVNDLDTYCCGNFGKIDFLLEAFTILKDNEILSLANHMIEKLVLKKENVGNYITHEATKIRSENPSFFRGLSGIGYVLLRSQNPSCFPSVGLLN
ncbi:MAG: type 2 lanthipeptide synthetase LanM family protein [Bacteroidota bacterium]